MVVPEHAEIPDANRRHQGADHLVELTGCSTKNTAERRIAHIEERLDCSLDRLVATISSLRLVLGHRPSRLLDAILTLSLLNAKRGVPEKGS